MSLNNACHSSIHSTTLCQSMLLSKLVTASLFRPANQKVGMSVCNVKTGTHKHSLAVATFYHEESCFVYSVE